MLQWGREYIKIVLDDPPYIFTPEDYVNIFFFLMRILSLILR